MEGFHLFQGKIKREMSRAAHEPFLQYVPQDPESLWDMDFLYEYEDIQDMGAFAHFTLEYSEQEKEIRLHVASLFI
ncbi:MAG: hypothetical protein FJZ63_08090 [Chlamydiae bacterium]|nr:hypothetical protein [Chlamydiota bacterium]